MFSEDDALMMTISATGAGLTYGVVGGTETAAAAGPLIGAVWVLINVRDSSDATDGDQQPAASHPSQAATDGGQEQPVVCPDCGQPMDTRYCPGCGTEGILA